MNKLSQHVSDSVWGVMQEARAVEREGRAMEIQGWVQALQASDPLTRLDAELAILGLLGDNFLDEIEGVVEEISRLLKHLDRNSSGSLEHQLEGIADKLSAMRNQGLAAAVKAAEPGAKKPKK